MELNITARSLDFKKNSKRLRRENKIPAVLYVKGQNSESITVDRAEFEAILRKVEPGCLPTTVFTLKTENGKTKKAVIKDIQYHVTTYNVLHMDFEELVPKARINVRVPINCVNVVDCAGVKLGGVLRQNLRHVRINCPSDQIPHEYTVDVLNLAQGEMKKVSDLPFGKDVKSLTNPAEVAVMIAKR